MSNQNVSAVLTEVDLQAIRNAIASIEAKLPFLITLLPEERKRALKMPENGPDFLRKVLKALKDHPEIVPGTFNIIEFEKDVTLLLQLVEIIGSLTELKAALSDTLMALCSEAMRAGNTGYDHVKTGAETVPGLKVVAKDIGTIYQNRGPKGNPGQPKP